MPARLLNMGPWLAAVLALILAVALITARGGGIGRRLNALNTKPRRTTPATGVTVAETADQTAVLDRMADSPAETQPSYQADTLVSERQDQSPEKIETLSAREMQVLRLIAEGQSNQAIADKLILTLSTVKSHTTNIYSKLGVRSRVQAVVRARELGIL